MLQGAGSHPSSSSPVPASSSPSGPSAHCTPNVTQHPSSALEKYLSVHFRVPNERNRLQVHVLSDHYVEADWAGESLPSSFLTPSEYLQTRHLILVSQFQPAHLASPDSRRKLDGSVLVMGLCVVEYAARSMGSASRCYIQYVDTTGMVRPRGLQGAMTRSLLKAYMCYAQGVLQVSCLHLFASPKPSLLFAGSEESTKKAVLSGRQLISWWLALLTETMTYIMSSNSSSKTLSSTTCTIYAYAPGEELLPASTRHTRHCIDKLQFRYTSPTLQFIYGVPYRGEDSALEKIPAFQDDPKWRHLEALLESPGNDGVGDGSRKRQKREESSSALTVREFFQTLGYRSDFAHDHSALISACFNHTEHAQSPSQLRRSNSATSALNVLKTLTFESETESYRSSARILALMKIMDVAGHQLGSDQLEDENMDPMEAPAATSRFKEMLTLLQPASENGSSAAGRLEHSSSQVSDLQNFVKRKAPRNVP